MISINRSSVEIPRVFFSSELRVAQDRIRHAYTSDESNKISNGYVDYFDAGIRDKILPSLKDLFKSKCAYCESSIADDRKRGVYDHFRPKSSAKGLNGEFSKYHYWWLTYEWSNLYYSCVDCNRYKSSWFPVGRSRCKIKATRKEDLLQEEALLLDPCLDNPEEHLVYSENGEVRFLSIKGKTTIEILKLNRTNLIKNRLEAVVDLSRQLDILTVLWSQKSKNEDRIKSMLLDVLSILSSDSTATYLGIKRQFFSKWLKNNRQIGSYVERREYEWARETKILDFDGVEARGFIANFDQFVDSSLNNVERGKIDEALDVMSLKHSYIDRVELRNYKCFSEFLISFDNENNGENEKWLLFLGENGVGKSSILKAITIAMSGGAYFNRARIATAKDLLKYGEKNGYIKVYLKGDNIPITVNFDINNITFDNSRPRANVLAYGAIRLQPITGKISSETILSKGIKAKNLFDHSVSLIDANEWLLKRKQTDFDRSAAALKQIMSFPVTSSLVRKLDTKQIVIIDKDIEYDVKDLSDGYQSIYSLAVDIMSAFSSDKVSFDVAEGIVLIDEIETHLHPRWKMEVVSQLRKTFPKMQFIVTSHDPLCLRGLRKGEVAVLTRNQDNNVVALSELPDPSELRVDQLLTSEFFGLNSTMDADTEIMFKRYYELLAINDDVRTQEQDNELMKLRDLVPRKNHLGDSLREELVYFVIDQLLASRIRVGGLKIREELKDEAVSRVREIWGELF